jgi:hypothetical protein
MAIHDCKLPRNSHNHLVRMQFYGNDVPNIRNLKELDSIDSPILIRVNI